MANSVDPDQTAPIGEVCSGSRLFASILHSSVMLGNYLQQMTSADDIYFQMQIPSRQRVNSIIYLLQMLISAVLHPQMETVQFFQNQINIEILKDLVLLTLVHL